MMDAIREDDDVVLVPVPLGSVARARLHVHAAETGKPPALAAGWLLSEVLLEDETFNAPMAPSYGNVIPFKR